MPSFLNYILTGLLDFSHWLLYFYFSFFPLPVFKIQQCFRDFSTSPTEARAALSCIFQADCMLSLHLYGMATTAMYEAIKKAVQMEDFTSRSWQLKTHWKPKASSCRVGVWAQTTVWTAPYLSVDVRPCVQHQLMMEMSKQRWLAQQGSQCSSQPGSLTL